MSHVRRREPVQLQLFDRGHDTCVHFAYRMSCAEYEQLLARSRGLCELCVIPGFEADRGKLHIDHDRPHGDWAVRGLLCQRCNTGIPRRSPTDPALVRYLEQSWFFGVLRQHGIEPGVYPEPEPNMVISGPKGQVWGWSRKRCGWVRTDNCYRPSRSPNSWRHLVHRYGPHNLRTAPGVMRRGA